MLHYLGSSLKQSGSHVHAAHFLCLLIFSYLLHFAKKKQVFMVPVVLGGATVFW